LQKIENVRQTLEQVQQTQNQVNQLQNDALNLNRWAGNLLEQNLGISKKDIDNLISIRNSTQSILSNSNNFDMNYKELFKIDYKNLSLENLQFEEDKILKEAQNVIKTGLEITSRDKERLNRAKELQNLMGSTLTPQGSLQAQQTSNQIAISSATSLSNMEQAISELIRLEALAQQNEIQRQKIENRRKEIYTEVKKSQNKVFNPNNLFN
ncbi:MAG: hypothetical protein ACRC4T_04605, partial [Cetobacterium sp.]